MKRAEIFRIKLTGGHACYFAHVYRGDERIEITRTIRSLGELCENLLEKHRRCEMVLFYKKDDD